MVKRLRRAEWFKHVNRSEEAEHIRTLTRDEDAGKSL